MKQPVRNVEKVLESLKVVGKTVITLKDCVIHFPVRYETVGLATVGAENKVYGFFNLIVDDFCAVMNVCSMIELEPSETRTFKLDDVTYYEMAFDAGSVVIKNTEVFRDDLIIQKIFGEFVNKGKFPYYTEYKDAVGIFKTSQSHAGANLGNFEGLAITVSINARDAQDIALYYRETLNNNPNPPKPQYVPAASVRHSASRTVAKLNGSYFDEGVVSALNNPTDKTDLVDYVFRY